MPDKPILLFLHGVGSGDPGDEWRFTLSAALTSLGYSGLDAARVIEPKYSNALYGVDDSDSLPVLTIKAPFGEAAKRNRRDFERREAVVEVLIGRHDRGEGWPGGNAVVEDALELPQFIQANNYIKNARIRAHVLRQILRDLPYSGRLVIVGHSLGSVIAADLVRRLPADIEVCGMVTIGSPLASPGFLVDGLRESLKAPPTNLSWWVNFWNSADPVTAYRGVSSVFPWMIDCRIRTRIDLHIHDAVTYLANKSVTTAVGYGLHGSRSRELAVVNKGVDIPLDLAETMALIALRYAYLTLTKLNGDKRERFANALRQVQSQTVVRVTDRNSRDGRPLPAAIADLAVDLSDPQSVAPEPTRIYHLSKEDAVVPLTALAAANVIRPFEIDVSKQTRQEAFEDLTIEMGLGRQFGIDVFSAAEDARKALSGGDASWIKWAALGVGAAAIVAATGGLALAAAPGVAGAAAVTSALAAFGPGGMIGGLLTAGTLVSAGGGGIAVGLASPTTAVEAVEAFVSTQLAAAILRKAQGLEQDPTTWANFTETGIELRREHTRLEAVSDDSSPTVKELKRKLVTIDRALAYLTDRGLCPSAPDCADAGDRRSQEFFERAGDVFRPVDLDGDGIPDRSRATVAAEEDASSVIKGAAAGVADAVSFLLRRKRDEDVPHGETATSTANEKD